MSHTDNLIKACFIIPHTRPTGGIRRFHMIAKGLRDFGYQTAMVYGDGPRSEWIEDGVDVKWFGGKMPVADIYITYANAPNDTIINDLPGKKVLFLLGLSDEDDIAKPFDGVMTTSNWLVDAARAAGHETVGKIGVGLEMSFKPKLEPSPARNIGTLVREPSRKDSKLVSEALLLTQSEIILSTLNVITFSDCDVRGPSQHYTKPTRKMIPHIYQQCGIWLVGSEREGFGMPGLEAMACGCALITTDTRGSREYAIHEETALIVKDSAEMALAIGRLVSDDDLREKLSYNGIKKSEQFVWPKVLMRADAFLRAVL